MKKKPIPTGVSLNDWVGIDNLDTLLPALTSLQNSRLKTNVWGGIIPTYAY